MLAYLTHPQVRIDPETPVPDWPLNDTGRARMAAAIARGAFAPVTRLIASAERKAQESAERIAEAHGLEVETRETSHENDRSATGFLPPESFEAAADAFFAAPDRSFRGWETARDAQSRIVAATADLLAAPGLTLVVGHGGVGTLLKCHLAGLAIDRSQDQSGGGGCLWCYDSTERALVQDWTALEHWTAPIA